MGNKFIGNSLTFKTFSFLKVNDTEIIMPDIYKKAYNIESDKKVKELKEFENMTYGVSREILNINKEYENLYRYYSSDNNDFKNYNVVKFEISEENPQLFDNHDIVADNGKKLRIILDYTGKDSNEKLRSSLIRILAHENSEVDLFIVNRDDFNTTSIESIAVYAEENAKVNICQYELGSSKLYTNFQADLVGKNSKLDVNSVYFGCRENELNMVYNVFHYGEKSLSNVVVNGALKDHAYKNFKSNLDFKEGSSASKGSEEEYAILLDEKVTAISVPLLLCHEDDVEGNHAASAGKIDQEQLFYIMTRGFSEEEAAALIIESKFSGAIDRLGNEELERLVWDMVYKTVKQ